MLRRRALGSWTVPVAAFGAVLFFIASVGENPVAQWLVVVAFAVLVVVGVVRGVQRPWKKTVAGVLRAAVGTEIRIGVYRSARGIVELTGRVIAVDGDRVWFVVTKPTPALSAQNLVRGAAAAGLPLRRLAWVVVDGVETSL